MFYDCTEIELFCCQPEIQAWLLDQLGNQTFFFSILFAMFWLKINSMEFVEIMRKTTFNFLKDNPFIHAFVFDLTGKESVRGNVNDYHYF